MPEKVKKTFLEYETTQDFPNLLLAGPAGVGKTSLANALCSSIGADTLFVNASLDRGIGDIRTTVAQFASCSSLVSGKKVVILDEFDYSNANSIQPALRGAIEEFANNCRFIITCNYKNRIIAPIHSRCTNIEFTIPSEEKPGMAKRFMDRLKFILDEESIEYEEEVLAKLILRYFPDFRRVINEIQRYSVSGTIDVGILSDYDKIRIQDLVDAMKEKNFTDARKWVVSNLDNSPPEMFRKIYDSLSDCLDKASVPEAILIIAEYQYKSAFVADQEINFVACIVELMMRCSFK